MFLSVVINFNENDLFYISISQKKSDFPPRKNLKISLDTNAHPSDH